MEKYQKLDIAMRYWLLGKIGVRPEYATTLAAMDFARKHHTGLRRGGNTPEFFHQLGIMHYLRTLEPHLMYPAQTLSAAALHDVHEDYNIDLSTIEELFGHSVAHAVLLLSKIRNGARIPDEQYFEEMRTCPIASIIKGADRINNLQSMTGAFSLKKQIACTAEVNEHFIPMLKTARRNFPQQEPAYENAKLMLTSQVELLEQVFKANSK